MYSAASQYKTWKAGKNLVTELGDDAARLEADMAQVESKLGNESDEVWRFFEKEGASGYHYDTKSLEVTYVTGSQKEFEKEVTYLNEAERQQYEVFVQHDKIVDANGQLVDTRGSVDINDIGQTEIVDHAIFVMSPEGKIYLCKQSEYGKFHHSSFLSGGNVSAAGELTIENGVIKKVTNKSGHYMPNMQTVKSNLKKELQQRSYSTFHDLSEINFSQY